MTDTENSKTPFEQRKSQNLHFSDYAKSTLLWAFLPLIAGGVTLLGGLISRKYFDNKLWPLDGSPTIIQSAYEKGLSMFTNKAVGKKIEIGEIERLSFLTAWLPKDRQLHATHNIWNFLKGVEVGSVLTIFHFWRKKEGQRLDLQPSYDRLKNLSSINPDNAELAADNASMARQLEHFAPHHAAATIGDERHHHGKLAEHEHHPSV